MFKRVPPPVQPPPVFTVSPVIVFLHSIWLELKEVPDSKNVEPDWQVILPEDDPDATPATIN
jgi:hypothetical protein